jgi:hypothetical protein
MISRRGFIGGLVGLIAAPAIVRASSLMPISIEAEWPFGFSPRLWLIINEITRESVRRWNNSNVFLETFDARYAASFVSNHLVRLPEPAA